MQNAANKIDRMIKTLNADDASRKHFAEDILWASERKSLWSGREYRVALIGITSSGKSTLINALMGKKLLPAKVRPSSNTLVNCRQGTREQATVHFTNGKTEIIKTNISQKLEKLADEQHNPGNKLGVKEIELTSPHLNIGERVQLVDSPGLGAWNLEAHEEITLNMLLPTADLVVYLTTTKANSDEQNIQLIEQISQEDKPVLIVQNMIDAVVPKITSRGVQKTKAEVIKDHKTRIESLLSGSPNAAVRQAKIVQISALLALQGKWQDSHLQDLIDLLKQTVVELEPNFEKGRIVQICRHLEQLVDAELIHFKEEEQQTKERASLKSEQKNRSRKYETLSNKFSEKITLLQNKCKSFMPRYKKIHKQIDGVNKNQHKKAEEILAQAHDEFRVAEKDLLSFIRDFKKETQILGDILNMRQEDCHYSQVKSLNSLTNGFKATTKQEETYKWIEKAGITNSVKRFFGYFFDEDWGTEKVYSTKNVFDHQATLKRLELNFSQWAEWFTTTLDSFIDQEKQRFLSFNETLKRDEGRLQNTNKTDLNLKTHREIITQLEEIKESTYNSIKAHKEKLPTVTFKQNLKDNETWVKMEVPDLLMDFYKTADSILNANFSNIQKRTLETMTNSRRKQAKQNIVIAGWDEETINSCLNRFWPDHDFDEDAISDGLSVTSIDGHKFFIINENKISKKKELLLSQISPTLRQGFMLYLLVDLHQPGIMGTLLQSSVLNGLPVDLKTQPVTWVVQSIDAILNDNCIGESFVEFCSAIKAMGWRKRHYPVIVNNESPLYSYLFDDLFNGRHSFHTICDELQFVENYKNIYPELINDDVENNAINLLRFHRKQKAVSS